MIILPVNWHEHVQVRLFEIAALQSSRTAGRILWDEISLAEAVRRWLNLPIDSQPLVTIFGTDTYAGAQIAELSMRADFPTLPARSIDGAG